VVTAVEFDQWSLGSTDQAGQKGSGESWNVRRAPGKVGQRQWQRQRQAHQRRPAVAIGHGQDAINEGGRSQMVRSEAGRVVLGQWDKETKKTRKGAESPFEGGMRLFEMLARCRYARHG
jgi:hypothetical protein